jgi:hypothetical protein
MPMAGGYRASVAVVRTPTLERVVERLTPRGWLRGPTAPTVLDALLLEPWIASLVVGLRRVGGRAAILERAIALAVVRGHPEPRCSPSSRRWCCSCWSSRGTPTPKS